VVLKFWAMTLQGGIEMWTFNMKDNGKYVEIVSIIANREVKDGTFVWEPNY
jgi:hypothetical protein